MSDYQVEIIDPEQRQILSDHLADKIRYELKANIHGACVKLLTDNKSFKDEWEDNFKFMNEDIRPHAKISSTIKNVVLLGRNTDNPPFRKLDHEEALNYMAKTDFCNPHQLVFDKRKLRNRQSFFRELFSKLVIYMLNTIETPQESLDKIKSLAMV